ncbi:transcriptional regulator [Streptomyces bohaiensis]
MEQQDAAAEFARLVRGFKERSGLSYGTLARRLHMSASTLHRYGSGAAVPVDYAPVERIARACGADRAELVALHRAWVLADAARPPRGRDAGARGAAASASPGGSRTSPGGASTADGSATDTPAAPSAPRGPTGPHGAVASGPGGEASPGPNGTAASRAPTTGPASRAHAGQTDTEQRRAGDGTVGAASDRPAAATDPGRPGGPTGAPQAHRGAARRRAVLAGALLLAAVAGVVVASPWNDGGPAADGARPGAGPPAVPGAPPEGEDAAGAAEVAGSSDEAPLDWTVRPDVWPQDCGHTYLVDRDPAAVPPPPVAQDAERWVADNDAVHGGASVVEATLRTNGAGPVVVEALHVRVVDRAEPQAGPAYATGAGCGGALSLAAFRVDLDETAPRARPTEGFDGESGEALPAPRLPFQVSDDEPLAVRVEAATEACDCGWYLEAEWSSGTERGTVRLDRDGRPFRTSGIEGNPRYVHDGVRWTPLVP